MLFKIENSNSEFEMSEREMVMATILPILGQVFSVILTPLLQWFFSGSVKDTFSIVPGVQGLDRPNADQPIEDADLPILNIPGEQK